MRFKKVAIIGVGLIGGSLGFAIRKKKGLAGSVVGVGRRTSSIRQALRCGAIDEATLDLKKGVSDADLVIIATPVGSIPKIARAIAGDLKEGAVVTDVGSAKGEVVNVIERCLPKKVYFVGSHPMAGSEKRGIAFAEKDLFKGSIVIMTKTKDTKVSAIKTLNRFWKALGVARIAIKSPQEHDKIVAEISHLPHLAASALVNCASDKAIKFASTGFKDTTRIAAADPEVWRDVCIANREEIIKSLEAYECYLKKLKALVKGKKAEGLCREFTRSKVKRERIR